jgi:hypothetical protein
MFGEFVIVKKRRGKGGRDWGMLGDWNNAGGGFEDLYGLEDFGNMGGKHKHIKRGGTEIITIGGNGGNQRFQGQWQTITIGGNGEVI